MNGPAGPTGTLREHFKQAQPRIMAMASFTGRKEQEVSDRPLSVQELLRLAQQSDTHNQRRATHASHAALP